MFDSTFTDRPADASDFDYAPDSPDPATYEGIATDGTAVVASAVEIGDYVDIFPDMDDVACLRVIAVESALPVMGHACVLIDVENVEIGAIYSRRVKADEWLDGVWIDAPLTVSVLA